MAIIKIKKPTIDANKFQKKIIAGIKMVEGMDMPESTRTLLLAELRHIHNSCLEWEEPHTNDFEILPELDVTIKREAVE